jgi:hypothetical protein
VFRRPKQLSGPSNPKSAVLWTPSPSFPAPFSRKREKGRGSVELSVRTRIIVRATSRVAGLRAPRSRQRSSNAATPQCARVPLVCHRGDKRQVGGAFRWNSFPPKGGLASSLFEPRDPDHFGVASGESRHIPSLFSAPGLRRVGSLSCHPRAGTLPPTLR